MMGHEAREDARSEYNAEIANEARHKFEGELPGIIEGAIEAGEYDGAVLLRMAVIYETRMLPVIARILRKMAKETP